MTCKGVHNCVYIVFCVADVFECIVAFCLNVQTETFFGWFHHGSHDCTNNMVNVLLITRHS